MMAILIHFLGHLIVDSAIPPYIESADSGFLARWYMAFAGVDLMALCFAQGKVVRILLAAWFAWSAALSVESMYLLDYMQRFDWVANYVLDLSLLGVLVHRYAPAFKKVKA